MSNILIIHAHPEPQSLSSALKDLAVAHLRADGHEVKVSDLYAMNWKAVADANDFSAPQDTERLKYIRESKRAFKAGTQTNDIRAEQDKLLWADAVLFSFPLWWYGMPAIMKGWFDRVFANGFGYGVGEHGPERWGDRYGGVNGSLEDVLWPIQHGMLFYPGMEVMQPFAVYGSDRLDPDGWRGVAEKFKDRLSGLFTDAPIPYRTQNGGHYDRDRRLKPGLGDQESGTRIHLVQPGDPEEILFGRVRRLVS